LACRFLFCCWAGRVANIGVVSLHQVA
jgi:hypothetical protein